MARVYLADAGTIVALVSVLFGISGVLATLSRTLMAYFTKANRTSVTIKGPGGSTQINIKNISSQEVEAVIRHIISSDKIKSPTTVEQEPPHDSKVK